jgi:SprT protein
MERSKKNKEDFFKRTIPHEVAHLVAFRVFGSRGHCKDWKFTMTRFGCDSSRCHSYNVSNVKRSKTVKRFLYECACPAPLKLTKGDHEKISSGARCRCLKCNKIPVFSNKILLLKS